MTVYKAKEVNGYRFTGQYGPTLSEGTPYRNALSVDSSAVSVIVFYHMDFAFQDKTVCVLPCFSS